MAGNSEKAVNFEKAGNFEKWREILEKSIKFLKTGKIV